MKNVMVRSNTGKMVSIDERMAVPFVNYMTAAELIDSAEIFQPGAIPFDKLPEQVRADALDTLKAYDWVHVTYAGGQFHVSPSVALKAGYDYDDCSCGTYYAKDLFTPEERRKNFVEVFGYEPHVI